MSVPNPGAPGRALYSAVGKEATILPGPFVFSFGGSCAWEALEMATLTSGSATAGTLLGSHRGKGPQGGLQQITGSGARLARGPRAVSGSVVLGGVGTGRSPFVRVRRLRCGEDAITGRLQGSVNVFIGLLCCILVTSN